MRHILGEGLIAALATPLGQSALAVVRASGPGCVEAVAGLFSRPQALRAAAGHSLLRGTLRDPALPAGDPRGALDDVLLGVFRAPRSYTGEEMVEISCHGSPPGVERIMAALFAAGFRQAEGGEFTLRAFLNGKMDLTRAEAVQEIVAARSRTAQAMALERLGGSVFRRIDGLKAELVQLSALVAVQLDYPDDEIDAAGLPGGRVAAVRAGLAELAASYRIGRLYRHGARVALAGRTNAGKSSLFNALVREERAIVSEIPGTTRDYLEAQLALDGVPVRLFDTAGLREVDELLESEGIRRSGLVIDAAALVLYVVDAATLEPDGPDWRLPADDAERLAAIAAKGLAVLLVLNKRDAAPGRLPAVADPGLLAALGGRVWPVSAKDLGGLPELLAAAAARLGGGASAEDAGAVIDSERQYRLLERAVAALDQVAASLAAGQSLDLVALDLQDALGALGEITGEVGSDDVLEAVFSGFCVGK